MEPYVDNNADIGEFNDTIESLTEYENIIKKTFLSENDGYVFFNKYAKEKGFSIRKDCLKHDVESGVIFYRRFVCSRAGLRNLIHMNRINRKRKERPLTRCECPVQFSIQFDATTNRWFVHNFVDEHNHDFAGPDEVPFLRSHRTINDVQKSDIVSLEIAGLRKHQIMNVLEHHHGGYKNVGFTSKDLYNFSCRNKKSRILEGDAETVLKLMSERQEGDVEFFYQYQIDAEGHLTNLFWCDAQSRLDYQAFGDVVVFDSTYRVNRYKMPFIPFVGSNHHRSTVIFACGVVSDETVDSYKWLLATFLMAMYQKFSRSVITDGDIAMRKAIKAILPNTLHRLCAWHIEQNVNRHLHHSAIGDFRKLLYGKIKEDGFEDRWKEFITRHKIPEDNKWANMMYKARRLWAAAYIHDKFFLGMKSNQRSSSSLLPGF
ncbi:protein FAR1-RELATED SEQUENCE 5-like [Ananas comosus]|uniref:Protein FAR1-RELATED SEQUENCE 5-like n=1 Tax=Ananas comosus TaxID=4615 RepID=A0A6P5EAP1_ANACO|nr:protein FAR1-RELATED SEQUENCE 5-like [Ananas comosus]